MDDMMSLVFKRYIFEKTHHTVIVRNIISSIVNARLVDKIKSVNESRKQHIEDNRKGIVR